MVIWNVYKIYKLKHNLGKYSMHNAILALTWTKLSCRTSQNVTSYVTVYMCYIMSFKTNNYILTITFSSFVIPLV